MLFGLLFSFLFSLSLIGWGLFFRQKLFPQAKLQIQYCFLAGLIGYFPVSVLAQALHLFFPISVYFQILIHFLGLALFLFIFVKYSLFSKLSWTPIAFFFLSLIVFVGYALQNDLWDDVSIYHMGLVGALNEEKLFLGWPNIHQFSLYLTNSHFISALMTPALDWYERADWSSVCALTLFTSYLFSLFLNLKKEKDIRLSLLLLLIAFCGLSLWGKPLFLRMVGFSGNDSLASVFSLSFLSLGLFTLLSLEKVKALPFNSRIEIFFLLSILIVLAVMAKTSQIHNLPLLGLLMWLLFKKNDWSQYKKSFFKFAAFVLMLPIIFVIHYFLTTGCFLPLIKQSCSSAIWTVDLNVLEQMRRAVSQFARDPTLMPNESLVFPDWLFKWASRYFNQPLFSTTIGLFVSGMVICFFNFQDPMIKIKRPIFVALSLSLMIWFILAPDTRFATALLVICMAYSTWTILDAFNHSFYRYLNVVLFIGLSLTVLDFLRISKQALERTLVKTTLDRIFIDLPVHHRKISDWGVIYYTPNNPDPNAPYPGCWWGPFPCSPSANPNLKHEQRLGYSVFTLEIHNSSSQNK